ncbi:MAG: hypothetical protein KDA55_02340, partial [Planctomycetales bacterium]|nr:hypothetical protein [Planctomycetales bacterium]
MGRQSLWANRWFTSCRPDRYCKWRSLQRQRAQPRAFRKPQPSSRANPTMTNIQAVADFLENFAPSRLAEDWDNVGL